MLTSLKENITGMWDTLMEKHVGILYPECSTARIVTRTREDVLRVLTNEGIMHSVISFAQGRLLFDADVLRKMENIDLMCKIVHGHQNRTGLIQGALHALGKKFAGNSLKTDLLSQDKILVKMLMQATGIPTPAFLVIDASMPDNMQRFIGSSRSQRYVLKPTETNSSIGMFFCGSPHELLSRLQALPREFGRYFVEEFIPGRVLTVGVVSDAVNGQLCATAPLEYLLNEGELLMDRAWKENPLRAAPAKTSPEVSRTLQRYAVLLHKLIGAEGITRSDFILGQDGEILALEINSNVGLSRENDVPVAAAASGLPYEDLICAHFATALSKNNPTVS